MSFLSGGAKKWQKWSFLGAFFQKKFFSKNIISRGKNSWKTRIRRRKIFLTAKNLLKWQKRVFLSPEKMSPKWPFLPLFLHLYKIAFFSIFDPRNNFFRIFRCAQSISRIKLPLKSHFLEKKIFDRDPASICTSPLNKFQFPHFSSFFWNKPDMPFCSQNDPLLLPKDTLKYPFKFRSCGDFSKIVHCFYFLKKFFENAFSI